MEDPGLPLTPVSLPDGMEPLLPAVPDGLVLMEPELELPGYALVPEPEYVPALLPAPVSPPDGIEALLPAPDGLVLMEPELELPG